MSSQLLQRVRESIGVASATAIWYPTGKPPVSLRRLLSRDPDGKFDPQALLSTDADTEPLQLAEWFIRRRHLEVTFQEVRLHLDVEMQRQRADLAITRATLILFGLFSVVILAAHALYWQAGFSPRAAAWYGKPPPTFSEPLLDRLVDMLCYAA